MVRKGMNTGGGECVSELESESVTFLVFVFRSSHNHLSPRNVVLDSSF